MPEKKDLRGWASLIIALTGLGTAIVAAGRKPPEEAAKAGYIELTTALIEVQNVEKKNHDDIEALRKYVDEHQNAHEAIVVPKPQEGNGRVVVLAVGVDAGPPLVAPLPPVKHVKGVDAISW